MSKYAVTRLTSDRFIHIPTNKGYNDVDIRPSRIESKAEKEALLISLMEFGIKCNESMCTRFVTVIDAPNKDSANNIASQIFDETLNSIFLNWHGLEELTLLPAGYTKNLETGEIKPIRPPQNSYFPVYHLAGEMYPQLHMDQWLSYNKENTEIAKALQRSLHWRRMGAFEEKKELKFLFNWISIESLAKTSQDDDIIPKLMLALGFPTSAYTNLLNQKILKRLNNNADFKTWKTWLLKLFKKMRSFRNDVVHNGFRNSDLPSSTIAQFELVLNMAVPRLQGIIENGYFNGITTLSELWEYAPYIIESQKNIIADVHGTIIFILNTELKSKTL